MLSGSEPMMRPDFFKIVARARELGLRVALSTDGSRLTAMSALKLAAYRVDYVGIQIEGLQPTHNHIRRSRHAYQRALRGLQAARNAGLRVGMRVALNTLNAAELPAIVSLAESECVGRFHLTQTPPKDGAQDMEPGNAPREMTLATLEWLFDHVWKRAQKGDAGNFVTSQLAADRAYLLYWMISRMPDRLPELRERIDRNAAAKDASVLGIDPFGNVHPIATGVHATLGNVREQPFGDIATAHPLRP
jgi:MoaA/NifB/PqqE/SkfB family radical SAM enzyme